MATAKRPDKVKFELTKPRNDLVFLDSLAKASIYATRLLEAVNTDQVIKIAQEDGYMLNQLKAAAKKIPLRLLFAKADGCIFVKPIKPSDQEERLIMLLREPRTINELMAVSPRLELHLEDTLARMAGQGTAHATKGKWVLTERGMDMLPKRAAVA